MIDSKSCGDSNSNTTSTSTDISSSGSSCKISHDWMLVMGDCHYCRDREWFVEYTPLTDVSKRVIGIGTVEIRTKRFPGSDAVATIRIPRVLHIPSAICNGWNVRRFGKWRFDFGLDEHKNYDEAGRQISYGEKYCGLARLALAEWPGKSYLTPGGGYMLSLNLTDEEEASLNPPVNNGG